MNYVELHARSAFSFLRGASTPEQLAEKAAALELPAMALCDRNGVYGAPRLFNRSRETGVRALVGAELTLEDQAVLPVLVESRKGYQNLCQLLTRAHLRSEKGKGRVCWDELPEFAEGLVALTGDEEGPLVREVRSEKCEVRRSATGFDQNARSSPRPLLQKLLNIFGPEHLFVEVQRHHLRGEEWINQALINLARHFHLPLLATNGVLHAIETERPILDVFTCIRNHTHLDAAGKLLAQNNERYLKTARQMTELFRDCPEAIHNTIRLADRLEFTLENLGYEFPSFPIPSEHTMDSWLRLKAFDGARHRYGDVPGKVRQQLETELALIQKLKVAGYFLIVWDIVQFCRQNNIMAQGRGSAANSTVCFCLGITAVDPLKFNTLFERFLTEGRKNSWPDIDIDLPSGERREQVIQEIYHRYGKHGAAMTANVITFRGRSAAREVGKALNLSSDILNRFSNLYANGDFPHTLDLTSQMECAGLARTHPRAPAFVALCNALRGLPRHLGQHSGGMIISQNKLDSIVPLENASMPNRVVAQWDKDDCEDLGIIKVDFLGLGMMSVLQDAVELTRQCKRPVDLAQLPQDDPRTFEMMRNADTIGVFQIESRAQMATLPRMKPTCFYDLVIEVAIIRPGPIQGHLMHPYLNRRKARERGADPNQMPCYHENLRPVLQRTLGVPLFQEQMLQIAMEMADFTGTEAEELRRALSFHRSEERMKRVEEKLRAAMERKGHSPKIIDEIAAAISSFALYGFPESHAISFAHLAYASAYLKAHHAPEFYASLLNNQPMGFYSSATLVKDGQRHGVRFFPVCVAQSEWDCTIEPVSRAPALDKARCSQRATPVQESDSIHNWRAEDSASHSSGDGAVRLGLRVVRGLSSHGAKQLLAERSKAPFASLEDCKCRVHLNKNEWRILAGIGALNCFASHRREALWEVEKGIREGDLFEVESSRRDNRAAKVGHPLQNDVSTLSRPAPSLPAVSRQLSVANSNRALQPLTTDNGKAGSTESCPVDPSPERMSSLPPDRMSGSTAGETPAATSPLPPMNYAERIQADFSGMHLTTGKHPMALLRSGLTGVCRASDLSQMQHGMRVCIAGNVICRQRPGTARGFVFISLEDETGISNAVVSPPLFEARRLLITEESFLLIEGRLQHIDNVIHVKAEKIERLPHGSLTGSASYDFH